MKKNLSFFRATLSFFLFSVFSNFAVAQNTLDKANLTASTPAAVAYSLRKMSTAYTGKAIQVRRSSDDTLLDIGFTANGDLDTAALKTFVGANNCFVATWYDQSGNGRNLATTGASQPSIVSNGAIYRRNSRPTLFHDANDGLAYSGADYMTTLPLSVNMVGGSNSTSATFRRAIQGSNNWLIGPYNNEHTWYANGFNHQIGTPWSTTEVEVFTVIEPLTNASTSWRKGVSQSTGNSKGTPGKVQTGIQGAHTEGLDGFISEFLGFNSELNTIDRESLETNQIAYYSFPVIVQNTKIFVDLAATGTGNGTSWTNAFTDFQAGINAAAAGDSVFVAKGTYQPASGVSFSMKEAVKIYGSFQGTEATLGQRFFVNSAADSSVLKGNGKRVITNFLNGLTRLAILDGFKITEGNSGLDEEGGGIYNYNASPTLNNLIIVKNTSARGGGISNNHDSSPVLSNLIILGNYATQDGGGIFNGGFGFPIITNLSIIGNSSGYSGGGIYNSSKSDISNTIISGNHSFIHGGGIYNDFSSSPLLNNVIVNTNKADSGGGGIYNEQGSNPVLINSTITGNIATRGGGIFNSSFPIIPTIKNSILFGNVATNDNGIYNAPRNSVNISYSLIQESSNTANGNLNAIGILYNDIFTNPIVASDAPTIIGDYTLKTGSPAINKGDNTDIPSDAKDLAGNPRIFEMTIDMGAYENQTATVLPVEFTSLTIKAELNSALLKWQTASESNNKKFIISRSFNGTDFTEIGTVNGAGNSQNLNSYTFTDFSPAKGINYYRLAQQDLNGTTKVLGIKALNFGLDQEMISVYPNPAEEVINIKFAANVYQQLSIINLGGQVIRNVNISNEQSALTQNVANLPAGTYLIMLKGATSQSQIKFIKK